MSASHMLAWYQEGFLPEDLLACGVAKTLSAHPPDAFYRPLKQLFRLVRAGLNYEPVADAALALGAPAAAWCEVPPTAVVADAPPPALVPALEQLRQLALQMAAQAGARPTRLGGQLVLLCHLIPARLESLRAPAARTPTRTRAHAK
jgi:hypothetical protein